MSHFKTEKGNQIIELVTSVINNNRKVLMNVGHNIWENPELAYSEVYAHSILTNTLEEFGFSVKRNYVLPTAFRAEFVVNEGPSIAILCEYDALPGIGHACGHNLIAESGIAAGLAVKTVLERYREISGKIIILGTPAEEGGGGKIALIKAGVFDNIDIAMMAHPDSVNRTSPLLLSISKVDVTYFVDSESKQEDCNTQDAAVMCYSQISLLRQHLNPNCRIMGIIKANKIDGLKMPQKTSLFFHLRAPTVGELKVLEKMAESCFVNAADTFKCKVHFKYDHANGYLNLVPNTSLTRIYRAYAEHFGIIFEDDNFLSCPVAVSSDIGNVSHVVPAMQPIYDIGHGHVIHSQGFTVLAGSEEAQPPTFITAQSLALTTIQVLRTPEILKDIKEEFTEELRKDTASN